MDNKIDITKQEQPVLSPEEARRRRIIWSGILSELIIYFALLVNYSLFKYYPTNPSELTKGCVLYTFVIFFMGNVGIVLSFLIWTAFKSSSNPNMLAMWLFSIFAITCFVNTITAYKFLLSLGVPIFLKAIPGFSIGWFWLWFFIGKYVDSRKKIELEEAV